MSVESINPLLRSQSFGRGRCEIAVKANGLIFKVENVRYYTCFFGAITHYFNLSDKVTLGEKVIFVNRASFKKHFDESPGFKKEFLKKALASIEFWSGSFRHMHRLKHYLANLQHCRPEFEKYIADGARIDEQDWNGNTILHYICWDKCDHSLKNTLQFNPNLNIQNNQGNTALHFAIARKSERILRLLLNTKVDLNIQNNQGNTPLHLAVDVNSESLLRLLLDAKVDLNIKNKKGKTPLDIASENQLLDIVELLKSRQS